MPLKDSDGDPRQCHDRHHSGDTARVRHRPVVRLVAACAAASAVVGVLLSGLLVPVAAATGQAADLAGSVFDALPSALPADSVPQTSVILAADGSPIAYLYRENRTDVSLTRMSPLIQHAVVAVEDSRFFEHGASDGNTAAAQATVARTRCGSCVRHAWRSRWSSN